MKESRRTRFYLDKTGFFAESAMIFLALAIVFRIIGCFTLWGNKVDFLMLLVLPVCACLLMIVCILIFGGKGFFLSFIPVLLGLAFFAFKLLFSTSWVSTVLRLVLYVAIAVIYTATVIGWIHTKWLLPPLFGLPFLYHVFVQDIPALDAGFLCRASLKNPADRADLRGHIGTDQDADPDVIPRVILPHIFEFLWIVIEGIGIAQPSKYAPCSVFDHLILICFLVENLVCHIKQIIDFREFKVFLIFFPADGHGISGIRLWCGSRLAACNHGFRRRPVERFNRRYVDHGA